MIPSYAWTGAIALVVANVLLGISFRSILAIIASACALFVGLLVTYQESLMYVPVVSGFTTVDSNPAGYRSPAEYGLSFEDTTVVTSDGVKIHVWYIPAESPSTAKVFLECHGNAGNLGLRLPSMVAARKHLKVGVAIFDYRGFGSSTGKPSEAGLLKDLSAVHDWLLTRVRSDQIVLHGRSVGGSLVIQHASKRAKGDFAGVLAENTFVSISKVVDKQFPYLNIPYVKELLLRLDWNTEKWLNNFPKDKPLLLISAVQDEIVPHDQRLHLEKIAKELSLKVALSVFPDHGHNDVWTAGHKYWSCQEAWLRSLKQ